MADTQNIAIVTGAGSGVGRETALLLAQAGWNVALVARSEDALAKVQQQIEAHGAQAAVFPTDLADPDACADLIQQVHSRFGRLDAIAHVAGYAPLQPMEKMTPDIAHNCMAVNLTAAAVLAAAAWPIFQKQKAGVIVNVSSMASFDPFPGFAAYAAAKAGLNMLTKALADEGKPARIRALAVAPGAIETPMLRAIFSQKQIPEDKTLKPQDVAQVIADCITGEREFDSGATIQMPSP